MSGPDVADDPFAQALATFGLGDEYVRIAAQCSGEAARRRQRLDDADGVTRVEAELEVESSRLEQSVKSDAARWRAEAFELHEGALKAGEARTVQAAEHRRQAREFEVLAAGVPATDKLGMRNAYLLQQRLEETMAESLGSGLFDQLEGLDVMAFELLAVGPARQEQELGKRRSSLKRIRRRLAVARVVVLFVVLAYGVGSLVTAAPVSSAVAFVLAALWWVFSDRVEAAYDRSAQRRYRAWLSDFIEANADVRLNVEIGRLIGAAQAEQLIAARGSDAP